MSGTRITDQQVCLYMSKRKQHSQEIAAAKAGISVRSARRIEREATLPSQKPRRYWRSRADPFADVWDTEVVPMLMNAPQLQAITILRKLQDDHPDQYPDSTRRTLERRVRHWRAMSGPPKEVFFPQQHEPGARGLSDFTDMAELRVTIASVPFAHRLYHFVLNMQRACRVIKRARSTHYYRSVKDPQTALRHRMRELAHTRVGYGYRRIHVLLKRESWRVSRNAAHPASCLPITAANSRVACWICEVIHLHLRLRRQLAASNQGRESTHARSGHALAAVPGWAECVSAGRRWRSAGICRLPRRNRRSDTRGKRSLP